MMSMIIIINNDNEEDDDDDDDDDNIPKTIDRRLELPRTYMSFIQDDGEKKALRQNSKSCADETSSRQVYDKSPQRVHESHRGRVHDKSSRQVKDGRAINRLFYRTVI